MNICFCGVPSDRIVLINEIITEELFESAGIEHFESGAELLESIKAGNKYDAAFLFGDEECIYTGKCIRSLLSQVFLIFIADSDSYAVDAYECGTLCYLLKSDSRERYLSALTKLYNSYLLLNKRYMIHSKQETVCVDIFDIDYIECRMKYTVFHVGGYEYAVRRPLYTVMEDLKELFIQVHQGFAVNPTKISMILRDAVVLEDGTSVMMSLRKRKETLECYKKRMNIFNKV